MVIKDTGAVFFRIPIATNSGKRSRMLKTKRNVSFLMVFLTIMCVFVFTSESSAASQPEWVRSHLDGTLKLRNLYHGVSFSEYKGKSPDFKALRLAKDRALDELCYQLSVSISSEFKDRIVKKGEYEEQHIASSLFISTRKVLSGVQEKDKWTDGRKHRHWALLVIDKKSADHQIEQQQFINEVVDRLEHKQDEILEGIKQMASVLNNNMQVYKDRMNQLGGLLKTIDSKVEASGDQTKKEYASLRQEIQHLESSRKAYEERLAESEKRKSEQIEELIAQNKELKSLMSQLSQRIQDDSFLALTDDDIKYKDADTDFQVAIRPDRGQGADYYKGEKARFLVQSSMGCYIKVIYISTKNKGSGEEKKINTVLFPNAHDRDNWINTGETKVIGRLGELQVQAPFGKDVITAIASERQFADIEEIVRDSHGGYYTEVTANTRGAIEMRTRGIQVVPLDGNSTIEASSIRHGLSLMTTDTCFIVSHPN